MFLSAQLSRAPDDQQKLVCILSEWSTSGHPTCVYLHLLACAVQKYGNLSWNVFTSTRHRGLALYLKYLMKFGFAPYLNQIKTQNYKASEVNIVCSPQTGYLWSTFVQM